MQCPQTSGPPRREPHLTSFIHSFRRVASSSLMGAGVCVAASKPPQRAQPCSKFTSPSKPNRNDTLPEGRLSVCIGVARAILGTMCCLLWVPASTRTRFRFALKAQKLRNTGGGLGAPRTWLVSTLHRSRLARRRACLPASPPSASPGPSQATHAQSKIKRCAQDGQHVDDLAPLLDRC